MSEIETQKEAAIRFSKQAISNGFLPEGLHTYRNIEGNILYWRIRLKHPDFENLPQAKKTSTKVRIR